MIKVGEILLGKYEVISAPVLDDKGARALVFQIEETQNRQKFMLKLNKVQTNEADLLKKVKEILKSEGYGDFVVDVAERAVDGLDDYPHGHVEQCADGTDCRATIPNEYQATILARNFARVLHTCSKNQIAYLDIKPLQHIFWTPDEHGGVQSFKVIDWNISKTNAEAKYLLDDLIKFCESVVEFYSGIMQDDYSKAVHPLEWEPESHKLGIDRSVSYAAWTMLAQISINRGIPFIPEIRRLLMPDTYLDSKNTIEILLDAAWTKIIQLLDELINLYETKNTEEVPTHPILKDDVQFFEDAKRISTSYSQKWLEVVPLLKQAAERMHKSKIKPFVSEKTIFQTNSEINIRICRLLAPGNAQYFLSWSIYSILRCSPKESDSNWHSFYYNISLNNWAGLAKEIPNWDNYVSNLNNFNFANTYLTGSLRPYLIDFWKTAINFLTSEIKAWVLFTQSSEETDKSRKLQLLKEVHNTSVNYPKVNNLIVELTNEISNDAETARLIQRIYAAQNNNDLAELKCLLDSAERNQIDVDEIKRVRNRFILIQKSTEALFSWNELLISQVEDDLLLLNNTALNSRLIELGERKKMVHNATNDFKSIIQEISQETDLVSQKEGFNALELINKVEKNVREFHRRYPEFLDEENEFDRHKENKQQLFSIMENYVNSLKIDSNDPLEIEKNVYILQNLENQVTNYPATLDPAINQLQSLIKSYISRCKNLYIEIIERADRELNENRDNLNWLIRQAKNVKKPECFRAQAVLALKELLQRKIKNAINNKDIEAAKEIVKDFPRSVFSNDQTFLDSVDSLESIIALWRLDEKAREFINLSSSEIILTTAKEIIKEYANFDDVDLIQSNKFLLEEFVITQENKADATEVKENLKKILQKLSVIDNSDIKIIKTGNLLNPDANNENRSDGNISKKPKPLIRIPFILVIIIVNLGFLLGGYFVGSSYQFTATPTLDISATSTEGIKAKETEEVQAHPTKIPFTNVPPTEVVSPIAPPTMLPASDNNGITIGQVIDIKITDNKTTFYFKTADNKMIPVARTNRMNVTGEPITLKYRNGNEYSVSTKVIGEEELIANIGYYLVEVYCVVPSMKIYDYLHPVRPQLDGNNGLINDNLPKEYNSSKPTPFVAISGVIKPEDVTFSEPFTDSKTKATYYLMKLKFWVLTSVLTANLNK